MAAVIRPIRIQHTDLRHGRIPLLLPGKILLDMQEILERHGKSQGIIQLFQILFGKTGKAFKNPDIRRLLKLRHQRFRFHIPGFPGVHRVDAVCLDPFKLFLCHISRNQVGHRSTDDRRFVRFQELYALHCGVRPLVKLPGQIFHGKHASVFRDVQRLPVKNIHGGFGKYRAACLLEHLVAQIFHIIADEYPHIFNPAKIQVVFQVRLQLRGLHGEILLLFHIDPFYICHRQFSLLF